MRASPRGIPRLRLLRICIKRSLPILHDKHSIFPKRLKCCVDPLKPPDFSAVRRSAEFYQVSDPARHEGRILLKNSCLIEGRRRDSILQMGGRIGLIGTRQEAQSALFYEFSLEDHVP